MAQALQVKEQDNNSTVVNSRAAKWLEARLERGQKERFTEIINITPDVAQAMLEYNIGNRSLKAAKIHEYAEIIKGNHWMVTHQGIAFAKDGTLNDGQHRLAAIIEADQPVKMTCTFGCLREEFKAVDYTKTRTAADLLHIGNKKYSALRASVAKRMRGLELKSNATANPQEIETYEESMNQDLMDEACKIGVKGSKITTPAAIGSAYFWIATHTKHKDKMEEFWEGLITGAELKPRSPILKARNLLLEHYDFGQRAGTQRSIKEAACIVLAWNAFVTGDRLGKLLWPHTTSLPMAE